MSLKALFYVFDEYFCYASSLIRVLFVAVGVSSAAVARLEHLTSEPTHVVHIVHVIHIIHVIHAAHVVESLNFLFVVFIS